MSTMIMEPIWSGDSREEIGGEATVSLNSSMFWYRSSNYIISNNIIYNKVRSPSYSY